MNKKLIITFVTLLIIIIIIMVIISNKKKPENTENNIHPLVKECFDKISEKISKEDLEEFRNCPKEDLIKYHMSLGMWVRNNCGLLQDLELAKYFKDELGINHPDSMSSYILNFFHQYLNNN